MHITESDLFTGLDLTVMGEIADICSEEQFEDGTVIFKEGESADNLYILEEGITDLLIDEDTFIYSLTERGEIFGWSSLVEAAFYTATAVCITDVKALKFPTRTLHRVLSDHPEVGYVIYRRLAGIFNARLQKTYRKFLVALKK
ncbi:MAG: cyclic nucleotide-binding domain-containing protein [Desulfobacterales bacterium]|nr:cyclic nucleotide-binding domain-containing protein [Desulfobacterales bacterium]